MSEQEKCPGLEISDISCPNCNSIQDPELSELLMSQQKLRADYAPSDHKDNCAMIEKIVPDSVADKAGLKAGMIITHIEGKVLRDMIDWAWYGDGFELFLEGLMYDEGSNSWEEFECNLERDLGQDWGIEFSSAVFDGIRTCKNACVFCFMSMLPKNMRSSLYLRDDDYRLSFLQGNFVTFTNMDEQDVSRVITQHISPLNMSLHVVDPVLRRKMIGKHAQRGLEVLESLLAHGIEIHAQIVLCPGLNDAQALQETLEFIEKRPGITSVGIVPLGFTKHQNRFKESFQDKKSAAEVIKIVRPFQELNQRKLGYSRYQLADEFYLWTQEDPPSAHDYAGYPQYYDGIGMYRYFIDEFSELMDERLSPLKKFSDKLEALSKHLVCLTGCAFAPAFSHLVKKAQAQGLLKAVEVEAVKNAYFGGNVDVAGLLCAEDVLTKLDEMCKSRQSAFIASLPEVMFNFDGLSLDGMHKTELKEQFKARGVDLVIVPTEPRPLFEFLCNVVD